MLNKKFGDKKMYGKNVERKYSERKKIKEEKNIEKCRENSESRTNGVVCFHTKKKNFIS